MILTMLLRRTVANRNSTSMIKNLTLYDSISKKYLCNINVQSGWIISRIKKESSRDKEINKIIRKNYKSWFETAFNDLGKMFKIKTTVNVPDRLSYMGYDIAIAHTIVNWGGKVKFKHSSDWLCSKKGSDKMLPKTNDPDYVLSEIDASGLPFCYESFDILGELTEVRWLSLRGSSGIDDWILDKIIGSYSKLEYLDISDCKLISERGLEPLYKLSNLKTMIVTNHRNSSAFDYTCILLEEYNSNLTIDILKPDGTSENAKEDEHS